MCVKFLFLLYLAVASGKRSFTILLDTTQSMQEEIDVIKQNIASVVNVTDETTVDNYTLVPFNDPDVGPPLILSTLDELVTSLNNISVSGGHDCPENCLAGIKKALEVSNLESYIFMFTDAYAKDDSKFNEIADLCRRTRSQVTIFLSGKCFSTGSKQVGSIDVYYDIARACSGNVFQFNPTNLRQAFRFMKKLVQIEWSDVITHDSFTDYKEFSISMDSATTDFLISVYGIRPVLQIIDSQGQELETENIVDTRNSKVVRLISPKKGENTMKINCQGSTSVTFYKRNEFPFEYGFFTNIPKTMRETSRRPIPGWHNYILIEIPSNSNVQLNAIELQSDGNKDKLSFEKVNENERFYLTDAFFEPQKTYKLFVSGINSDNNQDIKGIKSIRPQQPVNEPLWTQLFLEIIEPANTTKIIEYGENSTVACKVTGYPKPTIWWEDGDGAILKSEDVLLEIPNIHISYVSTDKLSKNGTIYCKAKNARGAESVTVDLIVKRTFIFNVLKTPEDASFEYGSEGKLYCQVETYPAASIKWYQNDTLMHSNENVKISPEHNMILLKRISQDDAGEYKCVVENEIERRTFTAVVSVTGLEAPEIEVSKTELVLRLGDWTEIDCKIIKGKPTPILAWRYKSNNEDEFGEIPNGVFIDEKTIKLPDIKLEHSGLYRCEAVNLLGQDYIEVAVKVQSEPKIKNDHHETITVKEGDTVELLCEVNAEPRASVVWDFIQDDVTVNLDERHTTYDDHTHRFEALWKDSGNYRCLAENVVGRAEKTFTINVLVPPYIQTPASKTVTVNHGGSVTLSCNVLFGNPVPSTKWEFIAPRSPAFVLSRNSSSLHLTDISKAQEGKYMCLAENKIGSDIIRIYLKVQ